MKVDRLEGLKATAAHVHRRAGCVLSLVGRDRREPIELGRAGAAAHATGSQQRTQTGRSCETPILIDQRSGSRNKGAGLVVRPRLQQVHRSSACAAHGQNAAVLRQQHGKVPAARSAAAHHFESVGPLAEDLSRSKIVLPIIAANYSHTVIRAGSRGVHAGIGHGRTGRYGSGHRIRAISKDFSRGQRRAVNVAAAHD